MKILKFLLYTVVILLVVYLVMCMMGPKTMSMSKSQKMKASASTIYGIVADYNQWPEWSPWAKLDPKMTPTVTGEAGTVGHKMEWSSKDKNVGSGSQTIKEVRADEYVKSELVFADWGSSFAEFKLAPAGPDSSNVTWTMDGGDLPFMARGMVMLMGGTASLEKDYISGLNAIQKIAEAKPKEPVVEFEIVDMPAQWYIGKMHKGVHEDEIDSTMMGQAYGEITKFIGGMDKAAGAPMSIAHNYNEDAHTMDLEIAIPVAAEMKAPKGLTSGLIPAGKSAKHVYHGPYEGLGAEWGMYMNALMKNYKPRWSGYEVYANDPMTVKSPSERSHSSRAVRSPGTA